MKSPPRLAVAGAAGALVLLHTLAALRIPVGAASDDALFILLARSIMGGNYGIPEAGVTWVPAQLPGLPILLTGPVAVVAPHWSFLRFPMLLFSVALIYFAWRLAKRILTPSGAAFAALLISLNRAFIGHAGTVLPDIPFAALTLALFEGLAAGASFPVMAAGAAFACLLRPHGVLLVGALALGMAAGSKGRKAAGFAALALLPWALWSAWAARLEGGSSFAGLWSAQAAPEFARMTGHAVEVLSRIVGQGCFGLPPWRGATGLGGAAWGLGGLILAGLGLRRAAPWAKAAGIYCALVLVLHMSWGPIFLRYALTVAPLLLLLALKEILPRLKAPGLVLGPLIVAALLGVAPLVLEGLNNPADQFQPKTTAFLKDNVGPGGRIQSLMPFSVALWTGRETRFPPQAFSIEQWRDGARRDGISHVHAQGTAHWKSALPGFGSTPQNLADWAAAEDGFELIFSNAPEETAVYRIRR